MPVHEIPQAALRMLGLYLQAVGNMYAEGIEAWAISKLPSTNGGRYYTVSIGNREVMYGFPSNDEAPTYSFALNAASLPHNKDSLKVLAKQIGIRPNRLSVERPGYADSLPKECSLSITGDRAAMEALNIAWIQDAIREVANSLLKKFAKSRFRKHHSSDLVARALAVNAKRDASINRRRPKHAEVAEPTPRAKKENRSLSVADVFSAAGLRSSRPKAWGAEIPERTKGVYIIATTADPSVRDARIKADGLSASERQRWRADQPVIYIGRTTKSLAKRIGQFYRHIYGRTSPHRGGQAVKLLKCPLWVYWSACDAPIKAESAMIEAFEARVGDLPFANRRR